MQKALETLGFAEAVTWGAAQRDDREAHAALATEMQASGIRGFAKLGGLVRQKLG